MLHYSHSSLRLFLPFDLFLAMSPLQVPAERTLSRAMEQRPVPPLNTKSTSSDLNEVLSPVQSNHSGMLVSSTAGCKSLRLT